MLARLTTTAALGLSLTTPAFGAPIEVQTPKIGRHLDNLEQRIQQEEGVSPRSSEPSALQQRLDGAAREHEALGERLKPLDTAYTSPKPQSKPVPSGGLAQAVANHDWQSEHWLEVGQPIQTLDHSEVPEWQRGVTGPEAALHAWGSMALVDDGIVFPANGGHNSYGGNEMYKFSFGTLEWSIPIGLGGEPGDKCKEIYSDGTPASTHPYDGLEYSPERDVVYRFGGTIYCENGLTTDVVWAVHNDHYRLVLENSAFSGTGIKAALNANSGNIIVMDSGGVGIFDPQTEAFIKIKTNAAFSNSPGTLSYDSKRDHAFIIQANGWWHLVDAQTLEFVKSVQGKPYMAAVYEPRRDVFVGWSGKRSVHTIDPETLAITTFPNSDGPAPTVQGSAGVLGKWRYVAEHDVFVGYNNVHEGVWFYRLPDQPGENKEKAQLQSEGFTCADTVVGWECPSLSGQAASGSIQKGVYTRGVTLDTESTLDFQDSRLTRAISNKGAVIVQADSILKNFTCIGIEVSDGNGACVRQQTANLTVENMTVRDSQEGVLTDTDVVSLTLVNADIENVGGDCSVKCGRAHGVYFASPDGVLTIRDSRFAQATDQGHLVKSGGSKTVIENTVLDERDGNGSRAIDAYSGGELILRHVTIYANSDDGNPDIIGWNYESRTSHPTNQVRFEDVTVYCDTGSRLMGHKPGRPPKLVGTNNVRWPNRRC